MIASNRTCVELACLETPQVVPDLRVGPVGCANKLAADNAVAVDDIGFRPHVGVKEACGTLIWIANRDQVNVAIADEVGVGAGVLIDTDSDNGDIRVFAMELEKRRQFFHAGTAPGGPEVEQNDLAPIVGKMDGRVTVRDGKVRCDFTSLGRVRTAVAPRDHGQGHERKQSKEAKKAHLSIIRSKTVGAKGQQVTEEGHGTKTTAGTEGYKPVLGLGTEPDEILERPSLAGTFFDQPEPESLIELTVIVPARNEEACLGACLQSLVSQSDDVFTLGRDWELVVVDDHSADRTAEIAHSFASITVLEAAKLEKGWTGKANAIWTAARRARGRWLLFTDADTVHEQGSLRRAIHEAERHNAGMLSYSPKQIVSGLSQRALMPLVFSELAVAYPPAKVSDPNQRVAAANGQFLLVEREAYRRIGGHLGVRDKVLEDVELAFTAKRRRIGLQFRYAEDAVSTRMYRTTSAMIEGWTKNLALLFNNVLALALWRALDFVLLFGLPVLAVELWSGKFGLRSLEWLSAGWVLLLLWARNLFRFYARVAKSNFGFVNCALAPLGLPLFVALLYRSWFQHQVLKQVSWKGRTYAE